MAHVVLNACGETSTTTGAGALTLANTAPANYGALQTLDTAITNGDAANGDTVDYHILDADGSAWETGRGTITNSTTLTRTTVYRSTNSDNAVSLSAGTHTILFSPSAMALTAPRGHIEFDSPQHYTYAEADIDGIVVEDGRGWIDDEYLSWSSLGTTTVSITEDGGLMYVYLYNNAGTVAVEVVNTAPAWNTDRGFWVKTADTTRRCIGWILTWEPDKAGGGGTERIVPFSATCLNRAIKISYSGETDGTYSLNRLDLQLVSNTSISADVNETSFSMASIGGDLVGKDIVPESMITSWVAACKLNATTGTGDDAILGISPVPVPGTITGTSMHYSVRTQPGSTGATFFGRYDMPYAGSDPVYSVFAAGTVNAEIECWGGSALI